jgi:RNA polymerase sigma factor (sigma-70 family)
MTEILTEALAPGDMTVPLRESAQPDSSAEPVLPEEKLQQIAREKELLADFEAGNKEAFGELYRIHEKDIRYQAYRKVDTNDAEDLVQSVFMRALDGLQKDQLKDTHRGIGPWLGKIAQNLAKDYYRKNASQPSFYDFDDLELGRSGNNSDLIRVMPVAEDIADSVVRQLTLDELMHQVEAITGRDKTEAVVAQDLLGMSSEEAAAFVSENDPEHENAVTPGAMRSRLFRSHSALREESNTKILSCIVDYDIAAKYTR